MRRKIKLKKAGTLFLPLMVMCKWRTRVLWIKNLVGKLVYVKMNK